MTRVVSRTNVTAERSGPSQLISSVALRLIQVVSAAIPPHCNHYVTVTNRTANPALPLF